MTIEPLIGIPVRFFRYDEEESDIVECDEDAFLADDAGCIQYERHTVFANGVSQICLTKTSF